MNRRHSYLPLALLGLVAPLGCARWQCIVSPAMVPPPSAAVSGGELPAAQAAKLCLTAGEALEKKGFTAEAIQQYENARKHDPQAPTIARRLAVLYDLQGDAARAEAEYTRAVQDYMLPVKVGAPLTRAEAEYVQALQKQVGDVELLNDIGYFHYRHGHLDAAESWLRNAVLANPKLACAWINLGQVLARQGRTEESYQAFAHVLRPAEAYSNLGVLLAKQGRTTEARRALQEAVALDPRLEQPRAFLNALPPTPALLPPSIRHSAAPAPSMPATPTIASPPLALSRPRCTQTPFSVRNTPSSSPVLAPVSTAVTRLPLSRPMPPAPWSMTPPPPSLTPCSSRPAPAAAASATDSPLIVNGPILPTPISCSSRLVPAAARTTDIPARTLRRHSSPPLPPPPPPPPPAVPRPSMSTDGPILIRTNASSVQPALAHSSTVRRTLDSIPPLPLPLMPPSVPMPRMPSRQQFQSAPQATLIDCQGEQ